MRNKKILALIFTLFFAMGTIAEGAKDQRKNRQQERRTNLKKDNNKRNVRKGQYNNKNLIKMMKRNRIMIRMAVKAYQKNKKDKVKLMKAVRMQKAAEMVFARKVKRPRQRRNYVIALSINARKLAREVIMANRGNLSAKEKKDGPTALDIAKKTSINSLNKLLAETIKANDLKDTELDKPDAGLGDDKNFEEEVSKIEEGED